LQQRPAASAVTPHEREDVVTGVDIVVDEGMNVW
jgi:hypothetical protein